MCSIIPPFEVCPGQGKATFTFLSILGVLLIFSSYGHWTDSREPVFGSCYYSRGFTARCTLAQSAGLRSHVVCLSVCPPVCPSVTLEDCDHIGWKSWKLIARTISSTPSLFVAKGHPLTPRETWGNFGETRLLMTPPTIHKN